MPCREEAVGLEEKAATFRAQSGLTGFSYIVALTEDAQGGPATAADSAAYAKVLGLTGFPVTADVAEQLVPVTPWNGKARPGKCVLTPTMEMLKCYVGEDDTAAFDAILAHAGK
ncbi:MAG: hypothetical protein AMXMBFR46_18880 [Acidimicrobiia bacterium]